MITDKELTIVDLAKMLNVSKSTVSRALNNHASISKKTKKKIIDKASRLGYRSNNFARNLRQPQTHTIGVIVHKINSDFIISILDGIEKITAANNFDIIIRYSSESAEKERADTIDFFHKRVDGLIVSLASGTVDYSHLRLFIKKKIPVVLLDRVESKINCMKVVIDNYRAGYIATTHLIEQGCRRIMHITGSLKRNVYSDRYNGYKDALAEKGMELNTGHVIVNSLCEQGIIETVQQILQMPIRPDGIFIADDFCAAVCAKYLKQANVSIPGDIAIVGFNNDVFSRMSEKEITTIHYPGKEMGEAAAKYLIESLGGDFTGNKDFTLTLPSELIVRSSSQKQI